MFGSTDNLETQNLIGYTMKVNFTFENTLPLQLDTLTFTLNLPGLSEDISPRLCQMLFQHLMTSHDVRKYSLLEDSTANVAYCYELWGTVESLIQRAIQHYDKALYIDGTIDVSDVAQMVDELNSIEGGDTFDAFDFVDAPDSLESWGMRLTTTP